MNGDNIKILFVCGCFEPGRDGVGDYTRQLANEFTNQGHHAAILALNDKYITSSLKEESFDNLHLPVLRLPSAWENEKKFKHAKEWIQYVNPDWISLQFVVYSYHPKGLPFGLVKSLKDFGTNVKWHIMFHEIWIGFTRISSLKHKITGYFQKKIILSLTNNLKPELITTSNCLYHLVLKNIGINSIILPLFSNIPVYPKNITITAVILDHLDISTEAELKDWKLAGIFGNLYPEANLENVLNEQLLQVQKEKLKLAFISFGKMAEYGLAEFKRLELVFAEKVKFIYLGEQSSENVSALMQLLNIGISCTPLQHIGKSGVFAAMKLHGLNVIVGGGEVIPEYDAAINNYHEQFVERKPHEWSVANITTLFVELLEKVENNDRRKKNIKVTNQ